MVENVANAREGIKQTLYPIESPVELSHYELGRLRRTTGSMNKDRRRLFSFATPPNHQRSREPWPIWSRWLWKLLAPFPGPVSAPQPCYR